MREPHLLDAGAGAVLRRPRLSGRDLIDIVGARSVSDVGDRSSVGSDDGRGLIVGLDPDQKARLSRGRAPAPQGPRSQGRLAALGDEDDVARVANPVAHHVLCAGVGDHRLRGSAPEVVRPQVEGAVATGREQDTCPIRREPRSEVEVQIFRQTALDTTLEIEEVDVEIQIHVGGECDRSTVGRPARLRVVPRPGGELARHAPFDGHQPNAALVRERDRRTVRRPGRIGRRGRHGRGEVGLHVHFARPAPAAHRGISSGKRARILALLRRRGRRDEDEAHEERGHRFHAQPPGG